MSRTDLAVVPALQFQRREAPIRVRKPARRVSFRLPHLVAGVLAAAAVFYGLYRLYGFLLTWRELDVRTAEVVCPDPAVGALVLPLVEGAAWGNILILDAARVRARVEACAWVRTARVRKVFPSSLKVEVIPRRPAAVLALEVPWLVDETSALLEGAGPEAAGRWPVLRDAGRFTVDREFKLAQAWACLGSLEGGTRPRAAELDLSDPENVVLVLRDDPTRLVLGGSDFGPKVAEYLAGKEAWTREAGGPLEYVDLRFDDRVYFKAVPPAEPDGPAPAPGAKEK